MKKSIAALTAAFALTALPAFAECNRETEKALNIVELSKPIPAGQAVAFLLQLDQDSAAWERLRTTPDEELGAVLNELAGGTLEFDLDSAYRLNAQHIFEEIPHIVVHVCQTGGTMNVLDTSEALKAVEGILYAAPDSTLEEIPIIHEPAPAPQPLNY